MVVSLYYHKVQIFHCCVIRSVPRLCLQKVLFSSFYHHIDIEMCWAAEGVSLSLTFPALLFNQSFLKRTLLKISSFPLQEKIKLKGSRQPNAAVRAPFLVCFRRNKDLDTESDSIIACIWAKQWTQGWSKCRNLSLGYLPKPTSASQPGNNALPMHLHQPPQ